MLNSRHDTALEAVRAINAAWLGGTPARLAKLLHPSVTFVFPGFAGRQVGREDVIAGFTDFCREARVDSFDTAEWQSDIAGDTAVVSFSWDMRYSRAGLSYRVTGRDVWVLTFERERWLATWRTMLDVAESAITAS